MSFIPQPETSEPLMKWREPNAYSKRDVSQHGRWFGFIVVLLVPSLLLIVSSHGNRSRMLLAAFFLVVGVFIFVRVWFGSGDVVCLKEDHVTKASNWPPRRTRYKDIITCSVGHDSYNDIKFFILTFTLKKGLPPGQVTQVVLPDDSGLERVLQILRGKGINIEGNDLSPTSRRDQ